MDFFTSTEVSRMWQRRRDSQARPLAVTWVKAMAVSDRCTFGERRRLCCNYTVRDRTAPVAVRGTERSRAQRTMRTERTLYRCAGKKRMRSIRSEATVSPRESRQLHKVISSSLPMPVIQPQALCAGYTWHF